MQQQQEEEQAAAQAADGSKKSKEPVEGGEQVPFEDHTEEEWNV